MNIRCLLGHQWREMPWFKTRDFDYNWWRPDYMCMRCFKEKRKSVIRIPTVESPGIGYFGPPYYEGQPPPEGYDSWGEYKRKMLDSALAKLRSRREDLG